MTGEREFTDRTAHGPRSLVQLTAIVQELDDLANERQVALSRAEEHWISDLELHGFVEFYFDRASFAQEPGVDVRERAGFAVGLVILNERLARNQEAEPADQADDHANRSSTYPDPGVASSRLAGIHGGILTLAHEKSSRGLYLSRDKFYFSSLSR